MTPTLLLRALSRSQTHAIAVLTAAVVMLWLALGGAAFAQSCNHAPTAANDNVEYRGEEHLWVDVLSNDGDADGQELSIVVQSSTCAGEVRVIFDALRLELPLNATDTCKIDYRVQDASGDLSATASVLVDDRLVFADPFASSNLIWLKCVGGGPNCSQEPPPDSISPTASAHRIVEATAAPTL